MKMKKGKFYGNASNKLCRKRAEKEGKAGSRQNMKPRKGRKEINNTWDVWRKEGIIGTKGMDNEGKNDSPRFSRESKSKSKLKSRNRWMEEWERGLARSADLASSWETGEVSRKPAVNNQNHQEVCKFNYFPRVRLSFQIAKY
ncbi:hypothetical protein WR25_09984 [Diploscapter pachys]|uniref:Uncharacterized protein n=1 Tax=Diploscapter pachys TaxID=2018661 RepID=A0A2A2KF83_9BILA|nr:hypothetical protein WR25_09984 [Diploscapter pachys]